ncbi:MAG: hypothetical protein PHN82_03915 [bacterium]|nr:hypothetical protein [bacterium]
MKDCDLFLPLKDAPVHVSRVSRTCRYHRRERAYPLAGLTPDGLCPAAFHVLYPDCLAMLSRGRYPIDGGRERCRLECPRPGGGVSFNVSRAPRRRTMLQRLELAARKAADLFMPVELLEHGIAIDVVESFPSCPYGYREGDRFVLNLGGKNEICPAAFYSVYPFFLPFLEGGAAGGEGPDVCGVCCDYKKYISFCLGRRREWGSAPEKAFFARCDDYKGVFLEVVGAGGEASHRPLGVNDLIEEMRIPCLAVLSAAYPYMLTLERGGSLGFLTYDRYAAGVGCPNLDVQVKMLVRREKSGGPHRIRIFDRRGECPRGLAPGEERVLPPLSSLPLPVRTLAALFPYIMALKAAPDLGRGAGRRYMVHCGPEDGAMEVRVFRREA